jgi:hypothetical protein
MADQNQTPITVGQRLRATQDEVRAVIQNAKADRGIMVIERDGIFIIGDQDIASIGAPLQLTVLGFSRIASGRRTRAYEQALNEASAQAVA